MTKSINKKIGWTNIEIECFNEAIKLFPPTGKGYKSNKKGRNQEISFYIKKNMGIIISPGRIASKIQVLL